MEGLSKKAWLAIPVGGFIAGTIDLTQAIILFGWRVPFGIAAGLLGRRHFQSPWIYALGIVLHFFIASSVTAIYFFVSKKLDFLIEHPLVCGLFYGIAVELVMSYVVLPLSALQARGPYTLHDILLGLGVHMIVIGLPVAYTVRYFRTRSGAASAISA